MAFTTLPQGYVSLVFMITAGRFSWGPGGQSPRRLTVALRASASFLHAEKGRGCASMTFFAGLRFHARTDRHTRLFQVWPEGHLLSSHEERRQRRAKGLPLGAPGNFVDFLFRKIDMNAATLSTDIKRAAAPGLGVAVFFRPRAQSSPGGPGPQEFGVVFRLWVCAGPQKGRTEDAPVCPYGLSGRLVSAPAEHYPLPPLFFICREIDSTIPIWASSMTREVPP